MSTTQLIFLIVKIKCSTQAFRSGIPWKNLWENPAIWIVWCTTKNVRSSVAFCSASFFISRRESAQSITSLDWSGCWQEQAPAPELWNITQSTWSFWHVRVRTGHFWCRSLDAMICETRFYVSRARCQPLHRDFSSCAGWPNSQHRRGGGSTLYTAGMAW